MAQTNKKQKFDVVLLWRVLRLAMPYRWVFISASVLAVIMAPVATLRPYLIQVMVDNYIFNFDLEGLQWITMILFGVLFFEVALRYVFIFSTRWLGQSVIRDLRTRVFDHLIRLRLSYFDRTPIGTSTTRTINDIETINTVFSQGVITIVADILTLLFVMGIMFATDWQLTLICLTTFPILIAGSYIFKEKVKQAYQIVRNQISKMNAFMQERITGMRIVQIFNAEKKELGKFRAINREYTQANLDSILYYAVFFPFVEIVSAASLGLMVWWGAQGMIAGNISPGIIISFYLYLTMLFRPIRFLADKFNTLQMGLVAAERVFQVLDNDNLIKNTGNQVPKQLSGKIEFNHVSFAYNAIDYVLKDVNFTIQPKETMAIVGPTGSGKSTIINLLNRFYELNQGQIKIDGIDLKEFELFGYRERIAMVLQDVFLFSGSVFDNITLRDPAISRETVEKNAKMIGAHDFIMALPGGYDYQVMERGATLSMGQRQLVSFVRALVFDPDILILDEATSSVDPETESVIQYAIEKMITKCTSIIIAHRLSTIRHADKILVLRKGKVEEFGRHDELLQIEGGLFRELYEMQFVEH